MSDVNFESNRELNKEAIPDRTNVSGGTWVSVKESDYEEYPGEGPRLGTYTTRISDGVKYIITTRYYLYESGVVRCQRIIPTDGKGMRVINEKYIDGKIENTEHDPDKDPAFVLSYLLQNNQT